MKKILTKGLTVAMVVAIMASGMAYADTTTKEKIMPSDRLERMKERIEDTIEKKEERMVFKAELDSLLEGKTDEEKVAALEDLINSGDYDGAALDHLSNMLDRIEEGEVIKAEMEALREEFKDLTKEERQAKIQEMIDSDDYDEAVTERLTKMLERKDQMGNKIRKKVGEFKVN